MSTRPRSSRCSSRTSSASRARRTLVRKASSSSAGASPLSLVCARTLRHADLTLHSPPSSLSRSPLYRCVQTATPTAQALDLPIFIEPGLGASLFSRRPMGDARLMLLVHSRVVPPRPPRPSPRPRLGLVPQAVLPPRRRLAAFSVFVNERPSRPLVAAPHPSPDRRVDPCRARAVRHLVALARRGARGPRRQEGRRLLARGDRHRAVARVCAGPPARAARGRQGGRGRAARRVERRRAPERRRGDVQREQVLEGRGSDGRGQAVDEGVGRAGRLYGAGRGAPVGLYVRRGASSLALSLLSLSLFEPETLC